ncbi:ribosome-associated protein [Balneicella halophila]|uniref:Ribosomal silencing factor RsfS n=1 Tax=Balneicella halophila TaxID=1537566 RepID=A0A7L4UNL0_BALHA|nr:ribosome silencing factor [Balneicella halophila]PVX49877.1 ribosome-associated protein [Balneicella halophila]
MKIKTEAKDLKNGVIEGLLENKGVDITQIDLSNIEYAVCKYFVLCTGTSNTHVDSLARSVEKYVQENLGQKVWRKEGLDNSQWVILDYVDVVVHIFQKEYREFYGLEALWADAPQVTIDEVK